MKRWIAWLLAALLCLPVALAEPAGEGTQEGGNVLDQFFVTEGNEPTQPGGEPTQPGSEPTQLGGEPTQPGNEPTQPGGEPTQPGSEPTQQGSEPTQPGGEPTQPGSEPTQQGSEPTQPGNEPTQPGGEPTQPGGEPTQPGGEPTQPSGEPTQPGGEPTQPGGEPTPPSDGTQPSGEPTPPSGEQTGGEETGEQPPEEGGEEAPAAQAWVNAGGEEPVRGDLADLLGTYGSYTIYLSTKDVIKLSGYSVEQLESYHLQPDPSLYSDSYTVFISAEDPQADVLPKTWELMRTASNSADVYVWVGRKGTWPLPEDAWMKDPNAAEGETKFIVGSLEDVLKQAAPGSVIYLQTPRVLEIEGYTVEQLEAFDIRPDDGMFSGGVVLISSSDPREEYDPDAPVGETVYVWVGEEGSWPPPAAVLNVTSENYVASGWSNVAPVFQLSGIPEGSGYTYAACINGETYETIPNGTYTFEQEGTATLYFLILDEEGWEVTRSQAYSVSLDFTPPQAVGLLDYPDAPGTCLIAATDALSGIAGFSVDGGETWVETNGEPVYLYAGEPGSVLAVGTVLARDMAGNISSNAEEYVFPEEAEPTPEPPHGGGGGGGGGGIDHVPADEDETLAAYNGVELKLPDTPMHVLTMGEQELPLTLNVVGGSTTEDFWFATDDAFVGEFSRLGMEEAAPAAEKPADEEKKDADKEKTDPKHDATVGPAPNALILTAEKAYDPNSGACVYEWKFNGEVYRQLANSGIEYLGLQAGDYMTALPTEGFTGGTVYTRMKMNGVATKEFEYTLRMIVTGEEEAPCSMELSVNVGEETYQMTDDEKQPMYYYDVLLASADKMDEVLKAYNLLKQTLQ